MPKKKYILKKKKFVNWMLDDDEDLLAQAEFMKESLIEDGKFSITTKELIEQAGYVPVWLCENAKEIEKQEDIEDISDYDNIKLID